MGGVDSGNWRDPVPCSGRSDDVCHLPRPDPDPDPLSPSSETLAGEKPPVNVDRLGLSEGHLMPQARTVESAITPYAIVLYLILAAVFQYCSGDMSVGLVFFFFFLAQDSRLPLTNDWSFVHSLPWAHVNWVAYSSLAQH